MVFIKNHTCPLVPILLNAFLLVPMLCQLKPILFLVFSHSNPCFFVGSYAFLNIANAFSLVPIVFPWTPMFCRWFLCFSEQEKYCWSLCFAQSNQCFFIGSYAFHIEAYVFSMVAMPCALKPMLFRWFLCFFM